MAWFSRKKTPKKDPDADEGESKNKREDNLCFLIAKGIGRIIFSQGFFVIIIIALTAIICNKAKEKNYIPQHQNTNTSEPAQEVEE